MRSASCGVVMEPSTSERSYGPLTTAREASRKLSISISPATASSSSSQSSRLNWHPSQDANFQTASLGFCTRLSRLISYLPFHQQVLHPAVLEDRAVLADKVRPVLAVPAQANGALHVALHRNVDLFRSQAVFLQFRHRVAHHDLRAADQRQCILRLKGRPAYELRDDADAAAPGVVGAINRDIHIEVQARPPAFEFAAIENIRGCPCAVEQRYLAVLLAQGGDEVHGGTQWRQPDATRDNHQVPS